MLRKIVITTAALFSIQCSQPADSFIKNADGATVDATAEKKETAKIKYIHNETSMVDLVAKIQNKESFVLVASNPITCKACGNIDSAYYDALTKVLTENNMTIVKIMPDVITGRLSSKEKTRADGTKVTQKDLVIELLAEKGLANAEEPGKVENALDFVKGLNLLSMPQDTIFIKGQPVSNDLLLPVYTDELKADEAKLAAQLKADITADLTVIKSLLGLNDADLAAKNNAFMSGSDLNTESYAKWLATLTTDKEEAAATEAPETTEDK